MLGNRSADPGADGLREALTEIEGAQASIARLMEAEAYDEALEQSEAMLRLAANLPAFSNAATAPDHTSRLNALMAFHTSIIARLRSVMDELQAAKRQRHKAIDLYTKL